MIYFVKIVSVLRLSLRKMFAVFLGLGAKGEKTKNL